MSILERVSKSKPKVQKIKKPDVNASTPFFEGTINMAYEDAKRGIIPKNVRSTYHKMNPYKVVSKPKIVPFTLSDISKVALFDKKSSKKLLIASLASRAEEYNTAH